MMKKLAIMLALAISLSGCSGGNSNTECENNGRFRKVYADFFKCNLCRFGNQRNVFLAHWRL